MRLVYCRFEFDHNGKLVEKEIQTTRVAKAPVLPPEIELVGDNTWQHVKRGHLNETVRSWRLMEA